MNCNNNQNNNGYDCKPKPAPLPEVADVSMNVCDKNINMLPMLQTYTTKVLKPNIEGCCKKNVLTQQMMNCEGYKYVIKWDFDLNGKTIIVPGNCILEFDGGSLKNGTIIGQDTVINNMGDIDTIFGEGITKEGTWRDHFAGGGGHFEQVQSDWNQTDDEQPDYIKNKPNIPQGVIVDDHLDLNSENSVQNRVITEAINDCKYGEDSDNDGNVLVKWYMLDNESNNRDNSTDPCMRYAGSKSMLSLVGLDEVYFEQTVKNLLPIFDKDYILGVKFQWYNDRGSWVQTDSYVQMNTSDGHFVIPADAVGGFVTYNLTLLSHQAAIFKEVVEAAKIYTNIEGENRLAFNENTPSKWMADQERYKDSLYIDSLVIERLGYSKWAIGDSGGPHENDVWNFQLAGVYADYIIDLGLYTKYNAIVVTGDDDYRCWFTFVTKYPTEPGETVQQSSAYGNIDYFVHHYVLPKQTLTRVIPSDAKYLVVSWRHGNPTSTSGYSHPKSVRFINTDVNKGALSYAKIVNDNFVKRTYPYFANSVGKSTNRLNEIKICSWNIGHYSMGEYAYSTIEDAEESSKATEYKNFISSINPDILLFNEFEYKFSSHYTSEDIFDYRMMWNYYKDRYCCQAMYSRVFMELVNIVYFPYSLYVVNDGFGDAMDYFCVYRTYINDHAITIASVHLRSGNETMNMNQCTYLINYLSGYSHVLIAGDFNREDMSVFTNAGYTVKITGQTYSRGSSLDHFVYKGAIQLSLEAAYATNLSDHYPIVAKITTTDNIKITGSYNERPSNIEAGFRYFDTTINKPIFMTEFGFWTDANGNPVSGIWKNLGALTLDSVDFNGNTVVVTQDTYTSSWSWWTNKKNNTIYRNSYVIEGDPFSDNDIIEISIVGFDKNIEWNLAYLDNNDEPVLWILDENNTPTYNIDKRIIQIPQHTGATKLRLRVSCDIERFNGKVIINKKV